jgi:hypothetical protein
VVGQQLIDGPGDLDTAAVKNDHVTRAATSG